MMQEHSSLLLVVLPLIFAPIVAVLPRGRLPWLLTLVVTAVCAILAAAAEGQRSVAGVLDVRVLSTVGLTGFAGLVLVQDRPGALVICVHGVPPNLVEFRT